MMFLFAGHSAGLLNKNFVKQRLHENFRIPAPWLTKEIIFVCTVFLSFTLRMTCERTLISALQALRKHYRICDTTSIKLRLNCFQIIFVGAKSDFDCMLNTCFPLCVRMRHMEMVMTTFFIMTFSMCNILSKNTALYW